MLEIIVISLFMTALAGLWDLKTTEVPDQIPAIMMIAGISYWFINGAVTDNFMPLAYSLAIGTVLLAAGLVLYKKGQWGGADAWILGAIGYTFPFYNGSLFILPYIMNFFVVSAAYMVVYAVILGIKNRYVFPIFIKDLKKNRKIFLLPLGFLAFIVALTLYTVSLGFAASLSVPLQIFVIVLLLTVFWRYGKVIEERVFKKKIPVSRLRPGDVLEEMNWVGLTKKQVASIRKKRKFVTIKEGVRFVPVFFLTLAVTLLYGNLLFLFVGL